jgi:hypothetical protein
MTFIYNYQIRTGTDLTAESGAACMTDFVIIPDPRENGVLINTDRFCGNGFITKTCK